jgi:hypothetical protein
MIDPIFLASLRRRHRSELVLLLVQLEQICPGWWLTLTELAEQLGTDRSTLNKSLLRLDQLGLVRRASMSNNGGTWIWWVQRDAADVPRPEAEPAWVLRDIRQRTKARLPLAQRWTWADQHAIPHNTMRSFLAGHQRVLRDRWVVLATPMDEAEQEVAA